MMRYVSMGHYNDSRPAYFRGHADGYAGRSKRPCGTVPSAAYAESDYELGYSTGARLALVQRREGGVA